ncbi:hypothetical protein N8470_00650 [bacterium]|nr:hypothetical protein [bacterium]
MEVDLSVFMNNVLYKKLIFSSELQAFNVELVSYVEVRVVVKHVNNGFSTNLLAHALKG